MCQLSKYQIVYMFLGSSINWIIATTACCQCQHGQHFPRTPCAVIRGCATGNLIPLNWTGTARRSAPSKCDSLITICRRGGNRSRCWLWHRISADTVCGYFPARIITSSCCTTGSYLKSTVITSGRRRCNGCTTTCRCGGNRGQSSPCSPCDVISSYIESRNWKSNY